MHLPIFHLLIIFIVQILLQPAVLRAEELSVPSPSQSSLQIRMNEIAWMGSDLSTADEWLELTAIPSLTGAVTTDSVNLRGWTVSVQKETGESVIAAVDGDVMIGSGQYIVIANSTAAASRLTSEPAVVSPAVSLPNTKLKIFLRDATGMLIDEVDDYVGAPFAGANPSAASGLPKATMERVDPRLSGTAKESWRTADTKRGLDAGSQMLGTPGFANGSIEPPDTMPPADLVRVSAFSVSGTLLVSWSPCADTDCAAIDVSSLSQFWTMPPASTGARLPMVSTPDGITIRTVDEQGNWSTGLEIQVQPLFKTIISEFIPNPPGSDDHEWIELQNLHSFPLDVSGWTLSGGSKRWMVPVGTIIQPQSVLLLPASLTGLQLPNAGGVVTLTLHGYVIDRVDYPETPEGVSIGRLDDGGAAVPLCLPTAGNINMNRSPVIDLGGIEQGMTVTSSINVDIRALSGSIAGASCSVDFGDGFISNSCNPPSHAMKRTGNVTVTTTVKDYCGNTVIHSESITVLGSGKSSTTLKQVESAVEPVCIPTPTDSLIISEVYPAPTAGEEEWVELQNTSDVSVDLCGWSLDDIDGGSKPFKLDGRSIAPGGYLALRSKDTGISWNNDADTVRLIAPIAEGRTGVVVAFSYTDSIKQQSFARRSDDVFVWSPYPSPGQQNRFILPNVEAGYSPVILSAALPNPVGADTFDEWIELENITGRPQWLNGWTLEASDGKKVVFDKRVLAKREQQKIPLYKTGMTLRNADGVLKLYDDQYVLRSVLAWDTSSDGHVYRPDRTCHETPIAHIRMTGPLHFRARTSAEPGTPFFDFSLSGVTLPHSTIDPLFSSLENEIQNYVTALIKNKKLVYKKCSSGDEKLAVGDADLAFLLLSQGFLFVDTTPRSELSRQMLVYEAEARMQRRGIWIDEERSFLVDAWRRHAEIDAVVQRDGLKLSVSHKPGLVMTGTVVSVSSNVPVSWEVRRGTGAYIPFGGGVAITGSELFSFRAWYEFLTGSGADIRSSVVIREYSLLQDKYPTCIRISEVYPSPAKGEHEWVELQNTCDESLSLLGWIIDDVVDAGSRPFSIGSGKVIEPHGLMVLSGALLQLSLNNGGDSVRVISPDKQVQDAMTYLKISSQRSIALSGGSFCTTIEPTPGKHNVCRHPSPEVPKAKKGIMKVREIGIRTLYASLPADESSNMNKKSDQYNYFMEGLNTNFMNDKSASLHSIIVALCLLVGACCLTASIWLKVRSYGSLS